MTLDEIDAALAALPITPTTDEDLIKRSDLMVRRVELYNEIHNRAPQQVAPSQPLVDVIVPPGGPSCVQSRSILGKFYYAEEKDGRRIIRMPWSEFYAIAFATSHNSAGPNGGTWLDCNPHLADRLPKNPQTSTSRGTTTMRPSDTDLLRKGLAAQIAREPHSIGDPDPTRKRELGEVEINLDSGPRRIRVAHDPQNGALHPHGIAILTAELDPALVRSFEATAAAFNQAQGREEQETQRILLGALLDRVMRRHKFVGDAVVRRLDHERFTAV
jgi:hypothetical protein